MGSLRARLTLAVVVVVGSVLGIAGTIAWRSAVQSQRAAFDERLERTAELSRATALAAVQEEVPTDDRRLDAVLKATQTSLRLLLGGRVLLQTGVPAPTPAVQPLGVRTITVNATPWRVSTVSLRDPNLGGLARLEVASNLAPLRERERSLAWHLTGIGLIALLVAAGATWFAAQRIVAPLAHLRHFASQVAVDDDLSRRVAADRGPQEVRSLAASVNAMLGRLDTSARDRAQAYAATRRFAADAGHELRTPMTAVQATLSSLQRHPDLEAERRTAMAREALAEQRRTVELLDGMQALARGDVAELPSRAVDLAECVDSVVASARSNYSDAAVTSTLPGGPATVVGWEPGLRMLIENLVTNAIRHGGGDVQVDLAIAADGPRVRVDDHGGGVAEEDRERIFVPFARAGDPADSSGSGLGLAIVAQQVRLHQATITVERAPSGGARFEVQFPAAEQPI